MDAGSNVHLVLRKFAEEAGWSEVETALNMQTIRERPRGRSTKVYRARLINFRGAEHEPLMYSMDSITANVEKVDMGPEAKLFNNKVVEEQINRPEGQVDMLIGCSLPDRGELRAGCRR